MKTTNLLFHVKTVIIFFALSFFSIESYAQWWDGSTVSTRTDAGSQVGLGILIGLPLSAGLPTYPSGGSLYPNLDIRSYPNEENKNRTAINIGSYRTSGTSLTENIVQIYAMDSTAIPLFRIDAEGNVIVGDVTAASPSSYNLYVEKGILTERVKVASSTNLIDWSDYVFDEGYSLMPLRQLESYIKTNKHLPDVPSAAEVNKEGIDLAAMDAVLLKKIEELTLHMIELEKQNVQLKKELDELKK